MNTTRVKLSIAVIVLFGLGIAAVFLPIARYALDVVDFVRGLGVWGGVLYGVIYALAAVLMVPGSVLTLFAGFLYSLAGGMLVVWPSSLLGATLAFLVSRFLARDWVQRMVAKNRHSRAINQAIGENAFSIIFLLRLSPLVPFVVLNYVLGATRARLSQYFLASAVGMLPGTLLYVYIGTLVTDAAVLASGDRPSAGMFGQILLVIGLVATAVVTVVISRVARARLKDHVPAGNGMREVKEFQD